MSLSFESVPISLMMAIKLVAAMSSIGTFDANPADVMVE